MLGPSQPDCQDSQTHGETGRPTDVRIRPLARDELPRVVALERDWGFGFVSTYSLRRHQAELDAGTIDYRAIDADGALVGFAMLVPDEGGDSVELRRLVIGMPGRGIGSAALALLQREFAGRRRLWLDVYERNVRARRMYQKAGFRQFGVTWETFEPMLLYEWNAGP